METKKCSHCSKEKELSDYHKKTKSADGRQNICKECMIVVNQKFRTINPKYQVDWQREHKEYWNKYATQWTRVNINASDDRSKIYTISSPDGHVYVGMSQTTFTRRIAVHRQQYRERYGCIPKLHKSFDEFGFDNHTFDILNLSGMDRGTLRILERTMIESYKQKGISLNKQK